MFKFFLSIIAFLIIFQQPSVSETVKVFHAGTQAKNELILTDGGRVLCVTALGKNTTEAQLNAYNCVKQINWKNCFEAMKKI